MWTLSLHISGRSQTSPSRRFRARAKGPASGARVGVHQRPRQAPVLVLLPGVWRGYALPPVLPLPARPRLQTTTVPARIGLPTSELVCVALTE
jgi:hypothetical protein